MLWLITTLSQGSNDDITTVNDFRQVGIVVDPTNYGTSTVVFVQHEDKLL